MVSTEIRQGHCWDGEDRKAILLSIRNELWVDCWTPSPLVKKPTDLYVPAWFGRGERGRSYCLPDISLVQTIEFWNFSSEDLSLHPSPDINCYWHSAELIWWTSQSILHSLNCCDMAGNMNTYGSAVPRRNEHRGCRTHSLVLKLRRENELQLLASTQTPPVLTVDFWESQHQ